MEGSRNKQVLSQRQMCSSLHSLYVEVGGMTCSVLQTEIFYVQETQHQFALTPTGAPCWSQPAHQRTRGITFIIIITFCLRVYSLVLTGSLLGCFFLSVLAASHVLWPFLSAPSYPAVCEFLQTNNLLSIIRAHEAQDAG